MTQSLKIECIVGDISQSGEVASTLVTKEQLNNSLAGKASLVNGRVPESQLPPFIASAFQSVNQSISSLSTTVGNNLQIAKDYAEAYTDEALSTKADLVNGKIPFLQLPNLAQDQSIVEALAQVESNARQAMITRTNELQASKADLGEDGKVLRELIPSYEKISGLPEQLELMSNQTADLEANVQQLTERQSYLMRTYASKELGVDANVGVKPSEYFYVRSANEEEMMFEYQNVGGVATATGKGYLSALGVQLQEKSASTIKDSSGKSQQEVNDLSGKKLSTTYDIEVVSASETRLLSDIYPTLAAARVDFPFVPDLSGSFGWAVLQKQFRELDSTLAAKKIISGAYYVNKPLTYNARSSVEWDLHLTLSGGVIGQYAITFDSIDVSKHSGKINLSCATADTYDVHNWSIRSWWDGILFKRVTTTDQTSLLINGRLRGQLVNIIGVINNGNYAQFGTITGTCGSRSGDWTVNITAVNNLGSASSATQTSELTLSAALPPEVMGHSVKIGTEYHYIRSVSGNKITVEMWVDSVNTLLHVIYGGIARSNGDNANMIAFKLLRGFRSASTYSCATTMGALVSTFGSEYNEIGVIAGTGYDTNANLSYLDVDQWYSEHNAMDIFDTRSGTTTFEFLRIKNDVGLGLQNWPSNVFKAAAKNNSFVRNKINEKPNVFLGEKWPRLLVGNDGFSESSRYVYIGEMREHIFKNDTQTILLDCTSKKIKNYGRNTLEIVQVGSGLNGGVTRTTLQCYIPFSFRNPSEVNGRAYYLGRTSKPRELKIVVNDDNIIDVYEVNTDAPQLLTDLSIKTGTGVFRFNVATTVNLGTNPPTASGVIRVQLYSTDIYVYEAVEELYSYSAAGVLVARKLRVKRGDNISSWIDMPVSQVATVANIATNASLTDMANKVNEILDKLKEAKIMV